MRFNFFSFNEKFRNNFLKIVSKGIFEFQKENRKKIIEISNLKTYNSELYIFFILFYFLIIYLYLYIYKENDRSVFCLFNETYFGYFPL